MENNVTPQPQSRQSSSNGLKVAVIILAILAAGGIGFSAYALISRNDSQDSNQTTTSTSQTSTSEDTAKDDSSQNSDSTSVDNTADYIYIGEWGLKFKIPADLRKLYDLSYSLITNTISDDSNRAWYGKDGISTFRIFGLANEQKRDTEEYGFYDQSPCSSSALLRIPKSQNKDTEGLLFSIGDYNYYNAPKHYACADSSQNQTGNIIQEALENRDNYSEI